MCHDVRRKEGVFRLLRLLVRRVGPWWCLLQFCASNCTVYPTKKLRSHQSHQSRPHCLSNCVVALDPKESTVPWCRVGSASLVIMLAFFLQGSLLVVLTVPVPPRWRGWGALTAPQGGRACGAAAALPLAVWHGMAWHGTGRVARYGVVWRAMAWHGVAWRGVT